LTDTTPPVHLRLRGKIDLATERLALRAALTSAHLLGLAAGTHLRSLRNLGDPLAALQARIEEGEIKARLAWEAAEILAARFEKVPERHRPHFTPAQRFRILEIRSLLAWNAHQTARTFLLSANTLANVLLHATARALCPGGTLGKRSSPVRRQ